MILDFQFVVYFVFGKGYRGSSIFNNGFEVKENSQLSTN